MTTIRRHCGSCVLGAILILGGPVAANASTMCDADKLEATGAYAACRLEADAAAHRSRKAPDYTKCDSKLARELALAERRSRGTCLAAADFQSIQILVAGYTDSMADVVAPADDGCPPEYANRPLDQVVDDLWNAIVDDDAEAIACNFHDEAFFFNDQAIIVSRGYITNSLRSLANLFGYAAPEFVQVVAYGDMVWVSYSLDAGWIVIPDAVDTYVVEAGKIRKATQHGLIEFTGPPPLPL